ncbi:MAG: hypothetical protein QOD42_3389 [Sphingomonadales bacterium]|jgi:hypothetical protein|nr:hypothetical protein [Sphingomonadales bacterium]
MIYEYDPNPSSQAIVGWGEALGVGGGSHFGEGVRGVTSGSMAGVAGFNSSYRGYGAGVYGETNSQGSGVFGTSFGGIGVFGTSNSGTGVLGITSSGTFAAVAAINRDQFSYSAGLYARKEGPFGFAGYFEGRVQVTRDLFVAGATVHGFGDCAEDFDVAADADPIEPGTVMVLGEDGALRRSTEPCDKRVVGVVSGAGDYQPAIILDRRKGNGGGRLPIALLGKVCCRADAGHGPIAVGDLLTTSGTPGHAMVAKSAAAAAGALIGKALMPLAAGRGLIPVLVTLG